jgi:ATP-dependent Clp protease, protease subunit
MYKKFIVDPRIRAKHADLVEPPIVVLVQKFDEEGVKEFVNQMEKAQNTGQPVIPIAIDSYGGSVYGCLDMIGHLEKATLPIHTMVTGKAMSAGAILFGMGQTRHMAENATLMLHDASMWTGGKTEEIKADAKEIERLNALIFRMISRNCGQKDDYFTKLVHEKGHADWFLTAKEAKKHKLCTNIGIPELKIEVSVNYDFG